VHGSGNSKKTFGAAKKFQKAITQAFEQAHKQAFKHFNQASISSLKHSNLNAYGEFWCMVLENIFF